LTFLKLGSPAACDRTLTMSSQQTNNDSEHHTKKKWYDYEPSKLWRFVAFCCLYGLFIVADAYGFFDHFHLLSIFTGTVATVALLYEAFHDRMITSRIFTSFAPVVVVFGIIVYLLAGPTPPPEPIIGWLQPANDPIPDNGCSTQFNSAGERAVLLIVGDTGYLSPDSQFLN
jgi:hypothetical protein